MNVMPITITEQRSQHPAGIMDAGKQGDGISKGRQTRTKMKLLFCACTGPIGIISIWVKGAVAITLQ